MRISRKWSKLNHHGYISDMSNIGHVTGTMICDCCRIDRTGVGRMNYETGEVVCVNCFNTYYKWYNGGYAGLTLNEFYLLISPKSKKWYKSLIDLLLAKVF